MLLDTIYSAAGVKIVTQARHSVPTATISCAAVPRGVPLTVSCAAVPCGSRARATCTQRLMRLRESPALRDRRFSPGRARCGQPRDSERRCASRACRFAMSCSQRAQVTITLSARPLKKFLVVLARSVQCVRRGAEMRAVATGRYACIRPTPLPS